MDRGFFDCGSAEYVYFQWAVWYPRIGEKRGREAMRAMHRFWTERGEIWAEDEYEVVDDGINWKTIAGVHLYLDGYRLGATLNPDGQLGLSVHAPCVRPANPEGLLARE